MVETTPDGSSPTTVVKTRYEGDKAVVQRQEAGKTDIGAAFSKCISIADAGRRQNSTPK
jgi:hypothetical protein